jgi:hypothetical protein
MADETFRGSSAVLLDSSINFSFDGLFIVRSVTVLISANPNFFSFRDIRYSRGPDRVRQIAAEPRNRGALMFAIPSCHCNPDWRDSRPFVEWLFTGAKS